MNPASVDESDIAEPYLLGCDWQGRVVWISDHTKSALGAVDSLPAGFVRQLCAEGALRVWPVLELRDTVVIGAQPEQPCKLESVPLEDRIVRNHRRLQQAERALSARVKSHARGARGKVLRQVESERQRLGRELHTGVGQMLAAIRLQLEVIAAQMPTPSDTVQRALDGIGKLAGDALEQVRGISRRLHPPEWQRLTLETALSQLWEVTGIPQRYQARLSIQKLPYEPPHEIKVLFYRAAQEGLANIARHSGATRVEMMLETGQGSIALTVRDDGRGFDASQAAAAPASIESGIGLRSIREEAADLNARLDVKSGPGGTTLTVSARFAPRG